MILITGGTGFIGSHTAVELITAGEDVVLFDNLVNSNASVCEGIQKITGKKPGFVEGDVRDETALTRLFQKYPIDAIIHFAALKAVPESFVKPVEYYENNVISLIRLLQAGAKHNVKKIVFSSSAAVYGASARLPIREDEPLSLVNSPYGMTKIICEKILADYARTDSAMRVVSLRYFNPVGAHTSGLIGELPQGTPNNLVPYLIQVAAGLREKLTVYGKDYPTPDGTCVRDFIHVTDLAQAHVAALAWLSTAPGNEPGVFNIGTGKGTSVLELIRTFENVSGRKLKLEFGERRAGDVAQLYADAAKAMAQLKWQPKLTLDAAMLGAWKWAEALRSAKN